MNGNGIQPKLVMLAFALQVLLDWLYVIWASDQPNVGMVSWFTLEPIIGYFYFAFSLVAILGLHFRLKMALSLAYILILAGTIFAVLSHELAFKNHYLISITIIPLIVLNLCVMTYLAVNQRYFKSE